MAKNRRLVADAMTSSPRCVDPDTPVREAARVMLAEDVGSLPVASGERLLGILTDRDIVARVVAEDKDAASMPVAAVASREVVTVEPDQALDEALALMARHQVRRLPVVENGQRLVGILAQADVARTADDESAGRMVEEISEPEARR